ncbi:MAG: hypothetical protein RR361_03265, partial [Anaerovorax sp.]
MRNGEWMKYDITIPNGGIYKLMLTHAAEGYNSPLTIQVLVDGVVKNVAEFTQSGAWGTFKKDEIAELKLQPGKSTVQILNNFGYDYLVDFLRLVKVRDLPVVDYNNMVIEAEDMISSDDGTSSPLAAISGGSGTAITFTSGGTAVYGFNIPQETKYKMYVSTDFAEASEINTITINGTAYSLTPTEVAGTYRESLLGEVTLNGKTSLTVVNTFWDTYHVDYLRFEKVRNPIMLYKGTVDVANKITKLENGTVIATATVTKAETGGNAVIVAALCKGDLLVQMIPKTYEITQDNEVLIQVTLNDVDITKTDNVKIMVWDGFSAMHPIMERADF